MNHLIAGRCSYDQTANRCGRCAVRWMNTFNFVIMHFISVPNWTFQFFGGEASAALESKTELIMVSFVQLIVEFRLGGIPQWGIS